MAALPRRRGAGFGSLETVTSDDDQDSQCSDTSTESDQSQATVISNVTSSTIRQSKHEVKISEAELGCLSSEVWKTLTWLRRRRGYLSPSRIHPGICPGGPPYSIKALIQEVKISQGSIDHLLDRGQRFLETFPDIKLKVDLENLAFYWRTYVKELQSLDSLQIYWLSTPRPETQTGICHLLLNQNSSALSDLGKRPQCTPRSQEWKQCVYKYGKSVENYKSQQHSQAPVTKINRQAHEIAKQPSSSVTEESKGKEASGSHFVPSLQVGSTIRKSTCFTHLPDLYKSKNLASTHHLYSSMEGLRSGPRSPLSARKGEGNLRTFSPTFDKTGLKDKKLGSNPELSFIPDSPTEPKRRRMLDDMSSNVSSQVSSRSHSPTLSINSETTLDDSYLSTPGCSPAATLKDQFKKRYSKYELTIESDLMDQCLMDYDLLEACKSAESDEENIGINAKVSLAEFQQQYRELSQWLDQVLQVTKRTMGTLALSEKYLTQSYHEELLKQSPRHKLFNEYAKQLLQRRSSLKGEITKCLNHVNSQWEVVEKAVSCKDIWQDKETMLKDLEADIVCLRRWLDGVENSLSTFDKPHFTDEELHRKLLEHQVLQRDIESHSRNVNAVLKLSEHLQDEATDERVLDHNRLYLERSANTLQQRWHSAWLLSLEAQCRLENDLKTKKVTFPSPILGSKWTPDLLSFDGDLLGGNVSGASFDDSFGLPLRQADIAESPLLDDSSFALDHSSFVLDQSSENQSGKDSAVVSEVEGKMSSEYSDSDLDMLKHHRLKSDSRDIGYSSGTTESLGHISTESDCEDIKKLIAGAERLVTPERSGIGNKPRKQDNSCDASSEESDGGSDVYSTASDDGGNNHEAMFDSVLGLDYNSDASLPQNLPAFHNTVKLRQRKCRKDRPWSAIQLTDIGDDFDISSLSRSETAIDRLSYGSEHLSANSKLGGSAATFPRAGAKRKLYESSQTSPPEGSVFDSSESETESSACSDDYETANSDIVVSDEDDGLNSTASVSEPAWDNYHQVYMSMGEDQEEQPLTWNQLEEDLEFDEIYPSPKNMSLVSAEMERRKKEGKSKPRLLTQSSRHGYDSDSDLEDLHYFLEDSASQLKITDHCLKKRRKDQFRTGIAMNSHKYAEIIATCQTNINCLQSVYNHLPADATDSQLENLKDMLYQWEKLHAFACERQQQSQALSHMCMSMSEVQKGLQSCEVEGTPQQFASITQVEQCLKHSQKNQEVLQNVQKCIQDLYKTGQSFRQEHPSINLDVFVQQLQQADLVSSLKLERVNQDLPNTQHIHSLWSEYVLLRGQLNGLLTDGFTEENLDLQDPNGPLYKVDQMISRLQSLRSQLSPFINEVTKVDMTMSMADIHEQLLKAQKHCRQLEQLAVLRNPQESMELTESKATLATNPTSLPSPSSSLLSSSSASWLKSRYVRAAAVFMMMGVAYMVDPDLVKRIGDFSVNVTPELRYVNGPPPV